MRPLLAVLMLGAGLGLDLDQAPRPPAAPRPAAEARLESDFVGAATRLASPVLDVAFLGDSQVVALTTRELVLLRWTDQGLSPSGSRPLPGPEEPVRWPGGLLHVVERDQAVWAIASTRESATLFALQSGRLVERDQARALPWPRCRTGLRYRAGTNLLEGEVDGLGAGPFLTLDEALGAAVAADGRLILAGVGAGTGPAVTSAAGDPRVGPGLAPLWSHHLAATTALPPGPDDALIVFAREGGGVVPAGRVTLPGPVRALAARPRDGRTRVVAGITEGGESRLVALELSPLEP